MVGRTIMNTKRVQVSSAEILEERQEQRIIEEGTGIIWSLHGKIL